MVFALIPPARGFALMLGALGMAVGVDSARTRLRRDGDKGGVSEAIYAL